MEFLEYMEAIYFKVVEKSAVKAETRLFENNAPFFLTTIFIC